MNRIFGSFENAPQAYGVVAVAMCLLINLADWKMTN
jgi:hypothetical protein